MRLLCCAVCLSVLVSGCAEVKPAATPAPPPARPTQAPSKKEPPPPPSVLSPQVGKQEEDRLRQNATARIERVEQLVKQIDQKKLAREQQDTFSTIQSFLSKAKEAMSSREFERAYNLADKAQLLAEEMSKK